MNYWRKYLIKKLLHFTPQYYTYLERIKRNTGLKNSDICNVIKDVPYYVENGYCREAIESYPILRKSDMREKENYFISKRINKRFLIKVNTSGSTGNSIYFWKTIREIIKEEAYISHDFSLIGKHLRVAVLRGNKPASGIYEYKYKHLLLSSYHLSKETVQEYVRVMIKHKINCLHVYPSSIHIFCKYLKEVLREKKIELPKLKGIFSSSEILLAETKDIILELFPGITLIDRYGLSEQVASAVSINKGFYHFYDSYGRVEFLDTGIMNGKNRVKEIIGTNITNRAMPLIRYGTEDFVEVDDSNNIVSIIGRTNDLVVNSRKGILPCTVVRRHDTMKNVISFQYYQDKIGELIIRVKVNERFTNKDVELICKDWTDCFSGLMTMKVEIVNDFEKTKNGKHIRCVQKLDLKNIK